MRRLSIIFVATAAAILLLGSFQTAHARKVDAIQCDGGVIMEGASKIATTEKCGAPLRETMRHTRRAGNVVLENDWLYDLGPEGFYILRFEGLGLKGIYDE